MSNSTNQGLIDPQDPAILELEQLEAALDAGPFSQPSYTPAVPAASAVPILPPLFASASTSAPVTFAPTTAPSLTTFTGQANVMASSMAAAPSVLGLAYPADLALSEPGATTSFASVASTLPSRDCVSSIPLVPPLSSNSFLGTGRLLSSFSGAPFASTPGNVLRPSLGSVSGPASGPSSSLAPTASFGLAGGPSLAPSATDLSPLYDASVGGLEKVQKAQWGAYLATERLIRAQIAGVPPPPVEAKDGGVSFAVEAIRLLAANYGMDLVPSTSSSAATATSTAPTATSSSIPASAPSPISDSVPSSTAASSSSSCPCTHGCPEGKKPFDHTANGWSDWNKSIIRDARRSNKRNRQQ
ncbi:hypothetical protein Cpir12675_001794 [Ceratocystis pirilliformis]|uniref:Proteophosphoglycan ppg4 n=1 Tax=Ceratocystis pirilliformis TaxID=259994 RepID=A0ABR3ZEI4_9PEZI